MATILDNINGTFPLLQKVLLDSTILETLGPSSFHYYSKIPLLPYAHICIYNSCI